MKPEIITWADLDGSDRAEAVARPAMPERNFAEQVSGIIEDVRRDGDESLLRLTKKFDKSDLQEIAVPPAQIADARDRCTPAVLQAIEDARMRISRFHAMDVPEAKQLETAPGLICEVRYQPIDAVGLYVPGGSAALVSTVLMLAIPARLAGCRKIVLCSPPGPDGKIAPEILAAAALCGVDRVCAIGGAQAIAAMAYGTGSVPRCNKLFGPGNAWVTEAKQQVSSDPDGAAIDMPAGPSEVLVIADEHADVTAVAWDLLSQAEHGPDSQVILVTDSADVAAGVADMTAALSSQLPRATILQASLRSARIIVTGDLEQAMQISNDYAPEHLIINTANARDLLELARNAGSIFIGPWTPESLGDYCSGTNHVLPTYGWARSQNALSVADFMRRYTVQEATRDGLLSTGPTAETLAAFEGLEAHRMAVRYRMDGSGLS